MPRRGTEWLATGQLTKRGMFTVEPTGLTRKKLGELTQTEISTRGRIGSTRRKLGAQGISNVVHEMVFYHQCTPHLAALSGVRLLVPNQVTPDVACEARVHFGVPGNGLPLAGLRIPVDVMP